MRFENVLIVHRIRQADVLGRRRQLYGRPLGLAGLAAVFWHLAAQAKRRG